jgi:hypothetical protein
VILILCIEPSKYKFVVVYILCAVCIQTSVSAYVIPRDLVKIECAQRVLSDGVVRHQVSVSSCVNKQFALVFRDNNHYQLDRVITV